MDQKNNYNINSLSLNIDAIPPAEIAKKIEQVGIIKSKQPILKTITLAILAGAYISLGAVFATVVTTGITTLPYGIGRLLGGLVFSLGLILVLVAGAELFTGNTLIIMAWAQGKVSIFQLIKNWIVVYLGNLIGALTTVIIIFLTGQYKIAGGNVGANALTIANYKCSLTFIQALALGIMCNALVCLAVWLCYSARSVTDKIISIIFPISAFVACSFEHSIANMYFIPIGLVIKWWANPEFWSLIGCTSANYSHLLWSTFLWSNLFPVTIGNIIGGSVLVGLIYWFTYLRNSK